jgi:hypothetical protein
LLYVVHSPALSVPALLRCTVLFYTALSCTYFCLSNVNHNGFLLNVYSASTAPLYSTLPILHSVLYECTARTAVLYSSYEIVYLPPPLLLSLLLLLLRTTLLLSLCPTTEQALARSTLHAQAAQGPPAHAPMQYCPPHYSVGASALMYSCCGTHTSWSHWTPI